MAIKLGTNLPEHLIATEPEALKDFLQAIEELGYGYVTVGDHVLGADLSVRPDWKPFFGKAPSTIATRCGTSPWCSSVTSQPSPRSSSSPPAS